MASEYRKQHAPQFAKRHLYNFELVTPQGGFGMDEDAIEGVLSTIASLQTALAAATERIETWREALAKCEADRSATKDELAAANARAERLQTYTYRCEGMCEAAQNGGSCRCSDLFQELPAERARAEAAEAAHKELHTHTMHTLAYVISKTADAAIIGQGPYTALQFHEFTLNAIDKLAADLQAQRERAEAAEGREGVLYQQLTTAEQSRDLTERVLVDTTEKLLAAERERDVLVADFDKAVNEAFADQRKAEADRDEAVGLLRRVWPEIVMGNNETVDNWQEEATTFLAATEES